MTPTLFVNATPDDRRLLAAVLNALTEHGFAWQAQPDGEVAQPEQTAALVLTVWSRASILDEMVVAKATDALRTGRLLPIRIEDVEPPIGFRQIQTFDLVQWSTAAGGELAHHIRQFFGVEDVSQERSEKASRKLVIAVSQWGLYIVIQILILYILTFFNRYPVGSTYDYVSVSLPVLISVVSISIFGFPRGTFRHFHSIRILLESIRNCRHDLYIQICIYGLFVAYAYAIWALSDFESSDLSLLDLTYPNLTMLAGAVGSVLLRYIMLRIISGVLWRPTVAEDSYG